MSKSTLYFELLDACNREGCPLCYLAYQSAQRHLQSFLREFVTDPEIRAELRSARGYCQEHAWQLAQMQGSPLSIAILYQDVLTSILRALTDIPSGRRSHQRAQKLEAQLQPTAQCPACQQRRTQEDIVLETLLKHIHDDRVGAALDQSSGLCLPHLVRALTQVKKDRTLQRLVALQTNKLAELQGELAEFIRKNDYRFRDEGFGPEADSWRRAISIVSGERTPQ